MSNSFKLMQIVAPALLGLQGCATVRLYPICQYAGAVDNQMFAAYSASITGVLKTLQIGTDATSSALLPDRRFLVVRAVAWKHEDLRRQWTELGCLGRYATAAERAKYTACREFIDTALSLKGPGLAEDTVLCFSKEICEVRKRVPRTDDADAVIYCNGSK